MFCDPLQRQLKQMEELNPSVHDYRRSAITNLKDRLYFLGRYLTRSVEYVPEPMIMLIGPDTGPERELNKLMVSLMGYPVRENKHGVRYTAI